MDTPRRQLWIAMSDLWLDTELDEAREREIASAVRDAGMTEQEAEEVFELELAPFLGYNLLSVAGEWEGFDPDWVCKMAEKQRRRSRFLRRLMVKTGVYTYAARPAWKRVKKLAFHRE